MSITHPSSTAAGQPLSDGAALLLTHPAHRLPGQKVLTVCLIIICLLFLDKSWDYLYLIILAMCFKIALPKSPYRHLEKPPPPSWYGSQELLQPYMKDVTSSE